MTEATDAADMAAAEAAAVALNQPQGDKTYLEPAAEEAEAVEENPGDDAAAAAEQDEDGAEKPASKPKQTAQERIDELTRARREAERRAEDAERRLALRTPPIPTPEPAKADDGEPDPAAYEHGELDARFIRDHATFHAKKTFREEQAAAQANARAQTAIQTFEQRVEAQFPDGEPDGLARLRDLKAIPPVVQELIIDSEIGPKLADHLGNNIRELNRISALPPLQQAREITKLEMKLADPPAPTPKTATDAPEPAPTLRGAGGRFKVAPDTSDFAAFEAQYKPGG